MPRPVRTRNPSRLAAQKDLSATPPIVANPPAVPLPKPPSSDNIYDVSESEKERHSKRLAARRSLGEMNPEKVNALEHSRRRRDAAMDKLANLTSTSKVTDGSSEDQDSPEIELSRREDAPSTKAARTTDVSGLDLDDNTFGNLEDSLDDSHNAIEDTRSGYRSTDTSSFNINLFKRRPRQSSIVGKDDAPIRPSSRGQNTPSISSHLNLGLFKRRAREPSILGTGQKDRSQRPASRATSVTSRNGNVTADEDSGPDDESTPLNLAKRRSGATQVIEQTIEASPTLSSRKRKSLESLESEREKRPALEQPEAEAEVEEIHQSIEIDTDVVIPSTPPIIPSTPLQQPVTDRLSTPKVGHIDPDMAPPASSGSSEGASPVVWPSLDALAHKNYNIKRQTRAQKTPDLEEDDNSSVLSSPPSLTHSPNFAATKPRPAAKKQPVPKVTTTADLTSLLPRRRNKVKPTRRNDPFEMASSSVEDEVSGNEDGEGDELSVYVDPKTAARRKRATAAERPLSRSSRSKVKGKEAEADKNKKRIRTYGSGAVDEEDDDVEAAEIVVASGDEGSGEEEREQEQQELDPETSQMMLDRLGEELQQAKKKFKEVDRWELSFEEVTESSSPVPEGR